MRVLLVTYGSRGDVEPVAGLAVALQALGAEARVCAPPDEEFAELLGGAGVPLVPFGPPVRSLVSGAKAADPFRVAGDLIAAHFDTIAAEAEGCDALVATGLMPVGVRSVSEKLGVRYVFACFQPIVLPSPHYPPPRPGPPLPPDGTDNRVLWDRDAQKANARYGEVLNRHRASIGLPPVDNVRDHVLTDRPWLASDPVLGPCQEPRDLDVVQTGAWILADERPLPDELAAFLGAGEAPVYVGFGSMAMRGSADVARVAVEAVRAQGRRVLLGRGWAGLALIDGGKDCLVVAEVNHQELFRRVVAVIHHGGGGTTTTAAVAGVPQVVVPQIGDQPYWAGRVAELGIGVALEGPALTFGSLSAALERALTSEVPMRAAAVAGMVRTGGASVAAKLLLAEAGLSRAGGRPRRG